MRTWGVRPYPYAFKYADMQIVIPKKVYFVLDPIYQAMPS